MKAIFPEIAGFDDYTSLYYPGGILNLAIGRVAYAAMGQDDRNEFDPEGRPARWPSVPVIDEDGDGELVDEIPTIEGAQLLDGVRRCVDGVRTPGAFPSRHAGAWCERHPDGRSHPAGAVSGFDTGRLWHPVSGSGPRPARRSNRRCRHCCVQPRGLVRLPRPRHHAVVRHAGGPHAHAPADGAHGASSLPRPPKTAHTLRTSATGRPATIWCWARSCGFSIDTCADHQWIRT